MYTLCTTALTTRGLPHNVMCYSYNSAMAAKRTSPRRWRTSLRVHPYSHPADGGLLLDASRCASSSSATACLRAGAHAQAAVMEDAAAVRAVRGAKLSADAVEGVSCRSGAQNARPASNAAARRTTGRPGTLQRAVRAPIARVWTTSRLRLAPTSWGSSPSCWCCLRDMESVRKGNLHMKSCIYMPIKMWRPHARRPGC